MRLDPPLIFLKIQLIWIKDHNVRLETLKWLELIREKTFEDRGLRIDFLKTIQLCSEIMSRIDHLYYMNLKAFCTARETMS